MTNEKMIEMFRTVIEDWDDPRNNTSELDLRPALLDVFHRCNAGQVLWVVRLFLDKQGVC